MKHKHLIPLSLLVAVIPFVSCSDDDENEPTVPGNEQKDPSDVIPNDTTPSIPSDTSDSNHPYVDLGLPSGTLWATYNVGATKPEEYGDYIAWGETETKEVYDWSTYKWAVAKYRIDKDIYELDSLTKYGVSGKYVKINFDNLNTLLPEDDAATVKWGNDWKTPTLKESKELTSNCYMVWTDSYNGTDVKGVIFYKAKSKYDQAKFVGSNQTPSADYSDSDAHIFLPAAGCRWDGKDSTEGLIGNYMTSSLESPYDYDPCRLDFDSNGYEDGYARYRCYGISVRAVRANK